MKKLVLTLACALILLFGLYQLPQADNIALNNEMPEFKQAQLVPNKQQKTAVKKQLGYRFTIVSSMSDQQQNPLQSSTFNGFISLKKRIDDSGWYGQITNAQLTQNQQNKHWAQSIYFTTNYSDFVFADVDFLGLPVGHPGHAIGFLLEQLSYQTDATLVINEAMGPVQYQYNKSFDKVTRVKRVAAEKPQQLKSSNEFWQLSLNNDWPSELRFYTNKTHQTENSVLNVSQKVYLEVADVAASWLENQFIAQANANLSFDGAQAKTAAHQIIDQASFDKALLQLIDSADAELAKAVGLYLLEHYSDHDLVNLINAQHPDAKVASLLIYALQKAGNFAAEVMLTQLYQHVELGDINKQRVLMSMGRFEGATEQTLNALTNITLDEQKTMADTALLSIGSLAKFSRSQKAAVEDVLAHKLAQPGNESMVITAIKNSGLTRFNDKVENMLGHPRESVNVAAIKLLSKDPKYQSRLVDYALNSRQAKSITALRVALSNQGLALTKAQKQQIEQTLAAIKHPVIKKQLVALLTMEDNNWGD